MRRKWWLLKRVPYKVEKLLIKPKKVLLTLKDQEIAMTPKNLRPQKIARAGSYLCNDSCCPSYRIVRRIKSYQDYVVLGLDVLSSYF